MSGKWNPTCQMCGFVLPAQAQRCPACGALVSERKAPGGTSDAWDAGSFSPKIPGGAANVFASQHEPFSERSLDVVLSLAPETSEEEMLLSAGEDVVRLPAGATPAATQVFLDAPDAALMEGASDKPAESAPNAVLLPIQAADETGEPLFASAQHDTFAGGDTVRQKPGSVARWASPRLVWGIALALLVLCGLVVLFARSSSSEGVIEPDWGLASARIGLVAVVFSGPAVVVCALLWRAQARTTLRRAGTLALVVILLSVVGLLSAGALHRLQGQLFEVRGQYGLALEAYQLSGDSLATDQNMVRIEIEWAEQLGTEHQYGEAVAALQPVLQLSSLDASLRARASKDLIQNYLAWGDQARQQQAFRTALARYQALGQAAYCDLPCQSQVHAATAQALLGLAQQLTAGKQYDQAIATYQTLVAQYSDTPESQEAQTALMAPQTLVGRLIYHDMTPAANFLVLLASQWVFDSTAQIFKLRGQQYQTRTDATGAFVLSSVAVGTTYMIAWVDANGNGGTCSTVNNQPLYTVHAQPLRATDAGAINIECA